MYPNENALSVLFANSLTSCFKGLLISPYYVRCVNLECNIDLKHAFYSTKTNESDDCAFF